MDLQLLLARRRGGDVKRFHIHTTLREHLVASHSWGVAMLCLEIDPKCRKEVLVAALQHDVAESVTGDMPAPTKWRFEELAKALARVELVVEEELELQPTSELTKHEEKTLKIADMADFILASIKEYQLGNREARAWIRNGMIALSKYSSKEFNHFIGPLNDYAEEIYNGRK